MVFKIQVCSLNKWKKPLNTGLTVPLMTWQTRLPQKLSNMCSTPLKIHLLNSKLTYWQSSNIEKNMNIVRPVQYILDTKIGYKNKSARRHVWRCRWYTGVHSHTGNHTKVTIQLEHCCSYYPKAKQQSWYFLWHMWWQMHYEKVIQFFNSIQMHPR